MVSPVLFINESKAMQYLHEKYSDQLVALFEKANPGKNIDHCQWVLVAKTGNDTALTKVRIKLFGVYDDIRKDINFEFVFTPPYKVELLDLDKVDFTLPPPRPHYSRERLLWLK